MPPEKIIQYCGLWQQSPTLTLNAGDFGYAHICHQGLLTASIAWHIALLKRCFFSPRFTGLVYGNLTLIDSGSVVAGRTGNGGYFVGTLFEVLAWTCLVPRNTSTETGTETN